MAPIRRHNAKNVILQRKVTDEETSLPQLPSPAEKIDDKLLLNVAIKHTTLSGTFCDTKFYTFSRRKSNGLVYAPKALYANGWLLRTRLPAYFEQLLSNTFGDGVLGDLTEGFPNDRKDCTDRYEYYQDSDLEDDLEDVDDAELEQSESATAKTLRKEDVFDIDGANGHTNDVSDSGTLNADTVSHTIKVPGKIVVLPDTAFATWNALIFYLYTGEVAFNILRSQANVPVPANTKVSTTQSKAARAPACSPKSMYRLADMLGLDDLKEKARKDILSKLTQDNILEELMSSFTSAYEEIRDAEIQMAQGNATIRKVVTARLPAWLDEIISGELLHTKAVFNMLTQKLVGA
ncbi:hypothetical protein EIP86_008224 [Pleurotus ostreatoroseus]|nr:hypothetical protein EIP86_008224 [Pleurotus ostreatoroseus]